MLRIFNSEKTSGRDDLPSLMGYPTSCPGPRQRDALSGKNTQMGNCGGHTEPEIGDILQ